MKIIHCADLHLDSKIDGMPAEKSKKRREEIIRSFERLVDFAIENAVRVIIIAGDLFDEDRITAKTKNRVLAKIRSAASVDFLYLSGNHDNKDVFIDEDVPANLKMFLDGWTSFEYGNVCITGVSESKYGYDSLYESLNLDVDQINIVAMHGQVAGYKSDVMAEAISLPRLKERNIDYLALGHIHSYSKNAFDERGDYAYCGCLDGRGFDELGKKGFVLIETDDEKTKFTGVKRVMTNFVPFSSRENHEETVYCDCYENWFAFRDEVISNLKNKYKKDDLIKLILKGEHKIEFAIDRENLESILNEEFFFCKVQDKTTLKISNEDFTNDKTVRGEFVRAVLESNMPEEKKSAVILLGLNALKGESIK